MDNNGNDSDSDNILNINVNSRKRGFTENRFREHFSSKRRKLRCDRINGKEVQLFCHESPWGGRVDTLKLSKQQVLLEQPMGGHEYETIRSYQYSVKEMHGKSKRSQSMV